MLHGLPANIYDWQAFHTQHAESSAEADYTALATDLHSKLNLDQRTVFVTVTNAIADSSSSTHFYLQGAGGIGKTFLYKAICYHYRACVKTVLCVASTGIAALLLPDGVTAHSVFKNLIHLDESSVSAMTKQSTQG